jgi:hypothetical protein
MLTMRSSAGGASRAAQAATTDAARSKHA